MPYTPDLLETIPKLGSDSSPNFTSHGVWDYLIDKFPETLQLPGVKNLGTRRVLPHYSVNSIGMYRHYDIQPITNSKSPMYGTVKVTATFMALGLKKLSNGKSKLAAYTKTFTVHHVMRVQIAVIANSNKYASDYITQLQRANWGGRGMTCNFSDMYGSVIFDVLWHELRPCHQKYFLRLYHSASLRCIVKMTSCIKEYVWPEECGHRNGSVLCDFQFIKSLMPLELPDPPEIRLEWEGVAFCPNLLENSGGLFNKSSIPYRLSTQHNTRSPLFGTKEQSLCWDDGIWTETTVPRFLTRIVGIHPDDSRLNALSDHLSAVCGSISGDNDELCVIEGQAIVDAYASNQGASSCMSGGRAPLTQLYADNPERCKMALLYCPDSSGKINPAKADARCLLWTYPPEGNNPPLVVMDRVYPPTPSSQSRMARQVQQWATKNGRELSPYRFGNNASESPIILPPIQVKVPANKLIPYMDTFRYGIVVDEGDLLLLCGNREKGMIDWVDKYIYRASSVVGTERAAGRWWSCFSKKNGIICNMRGTEGGYLRDFWHERKQYFKLLSTAMAEREVAETSPKV